MEILIILIIILVTIIAGIIISVILFKPKNNIIESKTEEKQHGIKAAVVTMFGGRGSTGCWYDYKYDIPIKKIDLTFDKTYLFIIRDKKTGEVWFTGTVYNPTTLSNNDR